MQELGSILECQYKQKNVKPKDNVVSNHLLLCNHWTF